MIAKGNTILDKNCTKQTYIALVQTMGLKIYKKK